MPLPASLDELDELVLDENLAALTEPRSSNFHGTCAL